MCQNVSSEAKHQEAVRSDTLKEEETSPIAQPRPGRTEAAAAIWNWAEAPCRDERSVSRTRLRGSLQAGVGIAVAGLMFWFGSQFIAGVILTIASFILLSALLSPKGIYSVVDGIFVALGRVVGRGLTWFLMVLIFYLVFLPYGLLFRRGKRDSMRRAFDTGASTYWERRPRGRSGSLSREHQY